MTDSPSRRTIAMAPLPMLCLLTACGGGGGSVASTPPPPTYTTLANATASTTLATQAASYEFYRPDLSPTPESANKASSVQISYDSATKTYQLRGTMLGTGESVSQSFGPSDAVAGTPGSYDRSVTTISRTDINRLTIGQTPNFTYASYGEWTVGTTTGTSQRFDNIFFSYGIATQAADMPKTGSASYALSIFGGGTSNLGGSGTLTANFAAATVDVRLDPSVVERPGAAPFVIATLTGSGTIAASGSNTGFASALSGNDFSGSISGLFYGPQASEVGGAFTANSPTYTLAGAVLGRKN